MPDYMPPVLGVQDEEAAAAQKYGLDPRVFGAIGSIESNHNPSSNQNKDTKYKGLYQLGPDEWKQYGGGGNIYNAHDNADAAARLLVDRSQQFQQQYGRAPIPAELYMLHQQVPGFFQNGTLTNVAGNPYPGMSGPQTPQSFMRGWGGELNRRMNSVPAYPLPAIGGNAAAVAGGGMPASAPIQTAQQVPGAQPLPNEGGAQQPAPQQQQPQGGIMGQAQQAPPQEQQQGILQMPQIPYYMRRTNPQLAFSRIPLPPGFTGFQGA